MDGAHPGILHQALDTSSKCSVQGKGGSQSVSVGWENSDCLTEILCVCNVCVVGLEEETHSCFNQMEKSL